MSAVAAVETLEFVWWVPLFFYSLLFVPSLLRLKKIHVNLRVLMSNVIVDCLLSIGFRLVLRLSGQTNGNGAAFCTVFSFANVWFLLSGSGTLLFLCAERYVATTRRRTYEQTGGVLSLCALILKYVLSAAMSVWIVFRPRKALTAETCSFVDHNPGTIVFVYLLGILGFLLGLTITLFLHAFNVRRHKQIEDDLSTRFQFKENIAATRMLSYQMQCYFGISLIGAPIAILNYCIEEKADAQVLFQLLNQTPFILYLFYLSFYLLHVTFWYDPFFFAHTKGLMDRFCCSLEALADRQKTELTVSEETDVYFKQMSSMWEAAASPKKAAN
ncbi:Sre G protein-coupled chemoreceptor [Aphelenchoides fujianensis]|nr:Sre G protein-coupled chemoreceptor [Aphelenchoides fujianensis]